MRYDVIVIGSGLGGLECGLILARHGMKVLILERQMQPGGCLQSFRRQGEMLDTGMHYVGGIGVGGCLHNPFKYLGLLDLPWLKLDAEGFDRVTIGERTYCYAEGYDAFVETLAQDFPHEREGLRRYGQLICEVEQHIFDSLMPHGDVGVFTRSLFACGAYDYLHETFRDELLINVLSGSSLKMELAPASLPLYHLAQANSSFVQGAYRLRGDGNLIVNRLVEQIRTLGGEVLCNAEVDELIEREGKLVAARCSNGEVYEADRFVSDVHPAVTMGLIKESTRVKRVYRRRMQNMENTYGMFTTSLLLKPGCLPYFNWNQYVYRRPNVWTYFMEEGPVQGALISCRCPEEAQVMDGRLMNRPDARIVDILTPLPWSRVERWKDTTVGHRGEEYRAMKEQLHDECVALAEQCIPGLRSMVEAHFTSTPLTYRDYTLTPQGSCYGVRKDYRNPMMTLISPRTPIPNLFLTGQNLTLHGQLGVTMTSLHTVSEILGRDAVWQIARGNA